jgi:mycothiol synthase
MERACFPAWETLGLSNLFMRNPDILTLPDIPPVPEHYVLRSTTLPESEHAGVAACLGGAFGIQHGAWEASRIKTAFIDEKEVKKTFVIEYTDPVTNETTIAGTASARVIPDKYPGSGYLHWVGVHPDHQGHKFGLILSLAVLYEFRDNLHCTSAVLETQDTSIPAIRIYSKLGFVAEYLDDSHPERWEKVREQL